jgi:hypothetical protein
MGNFRRKGGCLARQRAVTSGEEVGHLKRYVAVAGHDDYEVALVRTRVAELPQIVRANWVRYPLFEPEYKWGTRVGNEPARLFERHFWDQINGAGVLTLKAVSAHDSKHVGIGRLACSKIRVSNSLVRPAASNVNRSAGSCAFKRRKRASGVMPTVHLSLSRSSVRGCLVANRHSSIALECTALVTSAAPVIPFAKCKLRSCISG